MEDKDYFTEKELASGWRLSCKAYPLTDCELEAAFEEDGFSVLTAGAKNCAGPATAKRQGYGIAIDMGTTTLAAQLLRLSDGNVLDTAVSVNHQRSFGADVTDKRKNCGIESGRIWGGLFAGCCLADKTGYGQI